MYASDYKLDNVQVFYTHPGEGDRDGMVVGSTTIYDKVCQLLSLVAMSIVYTFATINCI